ncbi:MAG: hypothetical protein CVU69_10485 [Deltaproteobacteria bacterium HGW-Deltaproteobacteria-4]|nr:MAG: hypothetical protein CVU69_10485 [Deltaproteobacteria bacterium HGW-Deltaproteobacteria-4]
MKKFLLVLVLMMFSVSAWAECLTYDYAELNDMSLVEIQKAYTDNSIGLVSAMEGSTMAIKINDQELRDKYELREKVCSDQGEKIKRVWGKNFPDVEIKSLE